MSGRAGVWPAFIVVVALLQFKLFSGRKEAGE